MQSKTVPDAVEPISGWVYGTGIMQSRPALQAADTIFKKIRIVFSFK